MKSIMRMRFVPNHYYRELYQRLRSLSQSTKSVHEYFKEIKLIMIQANVKEDKETTMTRFINGLNHDIAYIMDLH
jgi:RNase adaptor protein for sRNA GlmZ degradation